MNIIGGVKCYHPSELLDSAFPWDAILHRPCDVIQKEIANSDEYVTFDISNLHNNLMVLTLGNPELTEDRTTIFENCTVETRKNSDSISWFRNKKYNIGKILR